MGRPSLGTPSERPPAPRPRASLPAVPTSSPDRSDRSTPAITSRPTWATSFGTARILSSFLAVESLSSTEPRVPAEAQALLHPAEAHSGRGPQRPPSRRAEEVGGPEGSPGSERPRSVLGGEPPFTRAWGSVWRSSRGERRNSPQEGEFTRSGVIYTGGGWGGGTEVRAPGLELEASLVLPRAGPAPRTCASPGTPPPPNSLQSRKRGVPSATHPTLPPPPPGPPWPTRGAQAAAPRSGGAGAWPACAATWREHQGVPASPPPSGLLHATDSRSSEITAAPRPKRACPGNSAPQPSGAIYHEH